ncbi:hypothetical protein BRC95_02495 [Halobacteriales archaeon QS_5_68_33]|nr:MAG: hypothetical protein BRC95_02495 [Halobacteriales archaeon QS_5_68_33]
MDDDRGPREFDDEAFPDQADLVAGLEEITLTPAEHQRIKNLVNKDLNELKGYERRYLNIGAGSDADAAQRRELVYELLDGRTTPPATAFELEDFGFTTDERRLWCRAFDMEQCCDPRLPDLCRGLSRRFNSRCSRALSPSGEREFNPFAVVVPECRARRRYRRATGASLLVAPTDLGVCKDGSISYL